ncbi:Uncharacterised protein [Vibrio cholerae]|nr:Uncharacterised protein [Vibrio cholerae]
MLWKGLKFQDSVCRISFVFSSDRIFRPNNSKSDLSVA